MTYQLLMSFLKSQIHSLDGVVVAGTKAYADALPVGLFVVMVVIRRAVDVSQMLFPKLLIVRSLMLCMAVVLAVSDCFADMLTIKCKPPSGKRVDFKDGKTSYGDDAMSSSYPTFIIESDKSAEALVLFPSSPIFGKTFNKKASKAVVVKFSSEHIVLIEAMEAEIWMYSFFLDQRRGVFQRSSTNFAQRTASMMSSSCEFLM